MDETIKNWNFSVADVFVRLEKCDLYVRYAVVLSKKF